MNESHQGDEYPLFCPVYYSLVRNTPYKPSHTHSLRAFSSLSTSSFAWKYNRWSTGSRSSQYASTFRTRDVLPIVASRSNPESSCISPCVRYIIRIVVHAAVLTIMRQSSSVIASLMSADWISVCMERYASKSSMTCNPYGWATLTGYNGDQSGGGSPILFHDHREILWK